MVLILLYKTICHAIPNGDIEKLPRKNLARDGKLHYIGS